MIMCGVISMPVYSYKATNNARQVVEGTVKAPTESIAAEVLSDYGLNTLVVKEIGGINILQRVSHILQRVSTKDLVIFSRQLSVMISANMPIVQALRSLIKQIRNPKLKIMITEIADEVDGGAKLSQALGHYPEIFDDFFVNIIRSGETSGKLDEVLTYLADQKEKDYDLMSKIKGAMTYPIFVLTGMAIVGTLMMMFVVPKLTEIFEGTSAQLPFSTRLLIGTSHVFQNYWWAIFGGLGLCLVGMRFILRTDIGRGEWDRIKLHIPVFGTLFQRIYIVRFSRSLHTLLVGGVNLTAALRITSDVVGNEVFNEVILQTVREVEDGNPLTSVMNKSAVFPPMVPQMLSVGERTGRLDEVLERMSNFYAREVQNLVDNLVTLIEPMIMIMMGVAVGMMVAAIILPMYNLAQGF